MTHGYQYLEDRDPSRYSGFMHRGRPTFEVDPVIEAYKRDVDRTLIRENLKRTVQERLDSLMSALQLGTELERAMKRARKP